MFAKILSISDVQMWKWYELLSFKSMAEIAALKAEVEAGRNPKDAKVALAKEITARFHSTAAADAAEQDFINRAKGGIPDDIPEVQLSGAPMGIARRPAHGRAGRRAACGRSDLRQRPQARGRGACAAGRQAQVRTGRAELSPVRR
jgi:tyrosyl-tRNA synthetase